MLAHLAFTRQKKTSQVATILQHMGLVFWQTTLFLCAVLYKSKVCCCFCVALQQSNTKQHFYRIATIRKVAFVIFL